jgi:hypothetical protein
MTKPASIRSVGRVPRLQTMPPKLMIPNQQMKADEAPAYRLAPSLWISHAAHKAPRQHTSQTTTRLSTCGKPVTLAANSKPTL